MIFDVNAMDLRRYLLLLSLLGVLAGCANPRYQAPVESRRGPVTGVALPPPANRPPPGIENAGKPGYYTVKPGDTAYHISVESKQSLQNIVAWNNLENPNMIEVGQVLRVVPPVGEAAASTRAVAVAPKVEAKPLDKSTESKAAGAAPAASAVKPAASGAEADSADGIEWMWPANGALISGFNDAKDKGINLAGKLHDPVYAAAAGHVVFAGSSLHGYGKAIIIKHNTDYITAYAHNDVLLVKEGDTVKRGQKIAEMGSTDSDRVELHFELRKQGKPIDPARVLPPR